MNPSTSDSSAPLEISPEQFGVIFQIAKELPNVSDQVIESQGCTRADASDLLRILRRARGEIGEATVSVRFSQVFGRGEDSVSASVIVIWASVEDMVKWRRMLDSVCESLGPEELFLRSGYREEEVSEALHSLSWHFPPVPLWQVGRNLFRRVASPPDTAVGMKYLVRLNASIARATIDGLRSWLDGKPLDLKVVYQRSATRYGR